MDFILGLDELMGIPVWTALLVIGLLTLVITIFHRYITQCFDTWRRLGIKGPRPFPIFGTAIPLLLKGVAKHDQELIRKYGKIVGTFEGRTPVLIVADTHVLQSLLVKDFANFTDRWSSETDPFPVNKTLPKLRGNCWKRVRTILSPAFSSLKLKNMVDVINDCSTDLTEKLETANGRQVAFEEFCGSFSVDVIKRTLFGMDASTNGRNELFVENAKKIFRSSSRSSSKWNPLIILLLMTPFVSRIAKLLNMDKRNRLPLESLEFFVDFVRRTIAERLQEAKNNKSIQRTDFLQTIIDSGISVETKKLDSEISVETKKLDSGISVETKKLDSGISVETKKLDSEISVETKKLDSGISVETKKLDSGTTLETQRNAGEDRIVNGKRLSDDEIVAQAFMFLIGGYETTTTAATFFAYNLSMHLDCQEKLQTEIDQFAPQGCVTQEVLSRMPYLEMCILESLRLYPPAFRIDRFCSKETQIDSLKIPQGCIVAIPVYSINNHEDYWTEPDRYKPERFCGAESQSSADQEEKPRIEIPSAFLSFGSGPRGCIGKRLAMLELKILFVNILRRFTIKQLSCVSESLVFEKGVLLRTKTPKVFVFEERRR